MTDTTRAAVQIEGNPITLTYTNYRGETAQRTITPRRVWFGSTEWHPEPQWLLTAFDHEKQADRDFALRDFGSPAQTPPEDVGALIAAAHGLSFGDDWNGGTAARTHGYREKLLIAIARIKGGGASPQATAALAKQGGAE